MITNTYIPMLSYKEKMSPLFEGGARGERGGWEGGDLSGRIPPGVYTPSEGGGVVKM
jgi:hypothetical protein